MKIHTNEMKSTKYFAGILGLIEHQAPDITFHLLNTSRSASHTYGYEVALRGHGTRHTRPPQTRILENMPERAATYDDWGWFISAIFLSDGDAKIIPYYGRDDFHRKTQGKYTIA